MAGGGRELALHYPEAKVVLTVRDPERWYDSARETIFRRAIEAGRPRPWWRRLVTWLIVHRVPDFALLPRMLDATVNDRLFGGRVADRDHCVEVFRRHVDEVRAAIPAERLLVFECREGWEPLCAFLGVPVPDEPFPRVNERAQFHRERPGRALRLIVLGR